MAAEVRRLLPHRYPMLMVDRVLEVNAPDSIRAIKAITLNEPWYARLGADPTDADLAYPEALLMESWGQTAGILANLNNPDPLAGQVMLFGSMAGVEFHRPVYPGDVVVNHACVFKAISDTVIFEGESTVDGERVVTVERMTMAFRPAATLRDEDESTPEMTRKG